MTRTRRNRLTSQLSHTISSPACEQCLKLPSVGRTNQVTRTQVSKLRREEGQELLGWAYTNPVGLETIFLLILRPFLWVTAATGGGN
jgi:hypothetical protein